MKAYALFYTSNGIPFDQKPVELPLKPSYIFGEALEYPGLTIFASENDLNVEGSDSYINLKKFRLEYYETINKTTFGYYYEIDREWTYR